MNQVVNLILCMYGVHCNEKIDKESEYKVYIYMYYVYVRSPITPYMYGYSVGIVSITLRTEYCIVCTYNT